MCLSSLPSCHFPFKCCRKWRFQPGACTQLCGSRERAGAAPRRRRCHVGRGMHSPSGGWSVEKQLFLHPDPFNSSHPKSYSDTSLSKGIPFGSQEWLDLSEKPLGKGSVCGLILRSSLAAAQQSLLSGHPSSVGYRMALGHLSPSSPEAAVTNSTMWCEIVSLLSSPGNTPVSCKCV